MELLQSLIIASEKAANIARVCRRDEHLFELLVQKKHGSEGNPRFVEDFKTLADVLIQEIVKHDLQQQFPELNGHVNGEENNIFRNTLGEEICVEIQSSEQETSFLLEKVLNGDQKAAQLLAAEVHRNIKVEDVNTNIPDQTFHCDISDLGIWIDPIDCTAEYINGGSDEEKYGISVNGQRCVTILIGAFSRRTGQPIIGVVNRPFADEQDLKLNFQCLWGVSCDDVNINCIDRCTKRRNIICLSSSESEEIKNKLREHGFQLVEASGAGHKLLTVMIGLSDAYLLTKGTTFKWDTCAPHAVLKSMGGDVLDFTNTIQKNRLSLNYNDYESKCNSDGLIAFRDEKILEEIVEVLGQ